MPQTVMSGSKQLPSAVGWKISVVILFAIGVALINLAITQEIGDVLSYLWPIIPILVFTIGLGLRKRIYGYTFALSYGATCTSWMFLGDMILGGTENDAVFVGGAGLAMTICLFLLVWVIFWKLWRVVSSVKDTSGEVRPSELL